VETAAHGLDAHAIAEGLAAGELQALYLLESDPPVDLPDAELWRRAMAAASTVVAHASFLTESIAEHADIVFPAEVYAEKEGTIVHPDGRLQRLRPAIARVGEVRAGWRVLCELGLRLGVDLDALNGAMASQHLFDAVPFYAGLTLEEIGGRGVRWQEREAASRFPVGEAGAAAPVPVAAPAPTPGSAAATRNGGLRLGTYRPIWAAPEVEISPALKFTVASQQVELAPEDAQRLGIAHGEAVEVSQNGTAVKATAHVRTGVQAGTAFLADGIAGDSANAFTEPVIEVRKR
jgi:NADH-quinone oxidoreductase subunit G